MVDECEYWLFRGIFIEVAIQAGVDLSDPNVLKSMRALTQKSIDEINPHCDCQWAQGCFLRGLPKDIVRMAKGTFRWVRGQGIGMTLYQRTWSHQLEQPVTPD